MSNKQDSQPKPSPQAMKAPQPGPAQQAQPAGQPSAQSLEQVREILFGEQSRGLEQRFAGLQNDFKAAIQQMGDDARKQRDIVQQQMRDELGKLSKQLDSIRDQQAKAMQQMKSDVAKSMQQAKDDQAKSSQQMREQQTKALADARDHASTQAKQMRETTQTTAEGLRKGQDELRTEVTRQMGELNRKSDAVMQQLGHEANQLRNEMVDRGMMSGVLSEMALRIGGVAMEVGATLEDDIGMDELLASRMSNPDTPAAQAMKGKTDPAAKSKNGGGRGK